MIVRIHQGEPAVTLEEADVFTAFSVERSDEASADDELRAAGVGYLVDPNNACVAVDSVIELAGRPDDQQWRTHFDAMLSYARGKGWLTEDGRHIRAHISPAVDFSLDQPA